MKDKLHNWEKSKMELTSLDDCAYTDRCCYYILSIGQL